MIEKHRKMINFLKKTMIFLVSLSMIISCSEISKLKYMGIYIVILSLMFMIELRNNILTLIVGAFIFWFNYSIIIANYFLKINSMFISDAYNEVSVNGLRILCFFISLLYICTDYYPLKSQKQCKIEFENDSESSSIVAFGYIIILFLILIYGFVRPSVSGERGSPSTIYEYSVCFFIVGYYYFNKIKFYNIIATLLLFLYAFQNLAYGGRITALQEIIIFFVLFINKDFKPNYKRIVPICMIGIIIFTMIGSSRGRFSFSNEQFANTITSLRESGLVLDTSFSAYYTSLTFIKTESILSTSQRTVYFFNWLLSQLIGGSLVPNSNVPIITRKYYTHYYGGVLPFYGHFHFGYFGVCLLAILPCFYLSKISRFNKASGLIKCSLLYFVVTTPRWYLYSPSPLIRGVFLLFLLYKVTDFANQFFFRANGTVGSQKIKSQENQVVNE